MVDALTHILPLLAPGGRLIDMHPNGEPPPLTVQVDGESHLVGWIREESEYESYHQADAALATAVRRGWYRWHARGTCAFTTYFDSLTDLRAYLASEWSDGYVEELVAMRIETFMQTAADKSIMLAEIVRIAHLEKT